MVAQVSTSPAGQMDPEVSNISRILQILQITICGKPSNTPIIWGCLLQPSKCWWNGDGADGIGFTTVPTIYGHIIMVRILQIQCPSALRVFWPPPASLSVPWNSESGSLAWRQAGVAGAPRDVEPMSSGRGKIGPAFWWGNLRPIPICPKKVLLLKDHLSFNFILTFFFEFLVCHRQHLPPPSLVLNGVHASVRLFFWKRMAERSVGALGGHSNLLLETKRHPGEAMSFSSNDSWPYIYIYVIVYIYIEFVIYTAHGLSG